MPISLFIQEQQKQKKITTKLDWSKLIEQTVMNSCKSAGASNSKTRRILFSSFEYPPFTTRQQTDLSRAYYTCLKRVYRCLRSLEMRCIRYWERYGKALSKLEDGQLLLEQLELCTHGQSSLNGHNWIREIDVLSTVIVC